MGGMLAFQGICLLRKNFSDFNEDGTVKTDVGVLLKVGQISWLGNIPAVAARVRPATSWLWQLACTSPRLQLHERVLLN